MLLPNETLKDCCFYANTCNISDTLKVLIILDISIFINWKQIVRDVRLKELLFPTVLANSKKVKSMKKYVSEKTKNCINPTFLFPETIFSLGLVIYL